MKSNFPRGLMAAFMNFTEAYGGTGEVICDDSYAVHPDRWQSIDVSQKPEMLSFEVLNYSFTVPVVTEDLELLRLDIRPNLPWADDHFLERVGRKPLNPGEQWANWPWGKSANRFRSEGEQFSHTYMERYWPKFAGYTRGGELDHLEVTPKGHTLVIHEGKRRFTRDGMRYPLGDLQDVVHLLSQDPYTRQAYLPVWFPEDTGVAHGQRVPCTLGYHFIMRDHQLHVVYYIRSCDYVRHFRDDIYLTVRLLLWVLEQLRKEQERQDPKTTSRVNWFEVKPGSYTMHITSLHVFKNDWKQLFGSVPEPRLV